jgi:undecaprenyl-diphosphatase
MDLNTLLTAIFLGIVEGLTEFLPLSSTGHLILIIDLLHFEGPPVKVFEIVIQLGAILAICWLYRKKLLRTAVGIFTQNSARRFALIILLGFLPSMVLGVLLHGFIKSVLFSPIIVSVMLIVGGIIIILIERLNIQPRFHDLDSLPLRRAFYVGCAQTLAMIPGTSRSGATIMGALLLGLDRKAATEFSFFLAIPTMFAATVYDLYKNYDVLSFDNVQIIAVGFISAFLAALLVVKHAISFISTHGFKPFAYYRIAVGSLMLLLLLG